MSAPATASPPRSVDQPTRRTQELGLLILGFAIGAVALANVGWGTGIGLPGRYWLCLAVMAIAGVLAHLAVRRWAPYAEPIMLPTAYLLNFLGLAMIYRLDIAAAERAVENGSPTPTPESSGQLTWTILGVLLLGAVLLLVKDHRKLQRYTYISMLLGVLLLLLPLFPFIGHTVNGATLWIKIGPLTFQPGELAKIVLTLFLAGYLVTHRDSLATVRRKVLGISLPRLRDTGPLLGAWLLALAIMAFETDLGTALIFYGLFIAMVYVATQRIGWVILGALMFALGATVLYFLFDHVKVRVQIWLDPFQYANDSGYQIVQSLYGFANGGMFGTGWGQGYPQFVPFASSDFILASFGEELGLTGMIALLLFYGILVQRGFRTAVACRDSFGRLFAAGLASVFALQVFVVAGGVTKLIPMTGLTTPFLSAGGSALIANWIMIGLLLRISDITRLPNPHVTPEPMRPDAQVIAR
ncbi:MAG: FtsW/RodA/SpoVE family cell cycle protein [Actinomycetia bacterium]|nr:FtsW/RodA/SpoVE family cell cycle protein [Actinomycetes bacterium]MCH9800488.1 FtsW/RodA/SpoVE family cell cycle protein [Actinomycetes bacterium]